ARGPARYPSRRRTSRCQAPAGTPSRDRLPHDHGVDAGRLVVAGPDPDLGEPVTQVKLPGPGIVLPHLEQDLLVAALGRLIDKRRKQCRAGTLTPPGR